MKSNNPVHFTGCSYETINAKGGIIVLFYFCILISVRGMQVPCRYPAGTLQVP